LIGSPILPIIGHKLKGETSSKPTSSVLIFFQGKEEYITRDEKQVKKVDPNNKKKEETWC